MEHVADERSEVDCNEKVGDDVAFDQEDNYSEEGE